MADSNDGGFLRGTKTLGQYGPLVVAGVGGAAVGGSLTDTELRATPVPVSGPQTNAQAQADGIGGAVTTAAPARIAASATVVTLMAANAARRSLSIYNEPAGAILYVKRGSAATLTDYEVQVPAGGYYEAPFPMYRGIVTGIWASASGAAMVTEGV